MTSPSATYEAQLPPALESAVAARHLLSSAVAAWHLSDAIRCDGELAVSELVTNAVLHARTTVGLRVERLGSGLRIEVEDGSSHLPAVETARPEDLYLNRSMTGRGLALVAASSDRWGCEPRPSGKVTWAEVGTGRRRSRPAAAPATAQVGPAARSGRKVHLVGVPVAVLLESTQQLTDLHREVQVMALGRGAPPELEQVVQEGKPWIADIDQWAGSEQRLAEAAAAAGVEKVDFDVFVPDDIAMRIEGVAAWLHRVARSIRRRQLLTLPPSPAVTSYRRWFGEEILHQLAGRPPRRCPVRVSARGS